MSDESETYEVAETGNQLTAIVNMVERVAMNPDADMAKLEKMLDMQERVLDRDAKMAFSRAMSAAQSEMKRVAADGDNPQTRSKYATYAALDRVLRPIYTNHGFSLSFNTEEAPHENTVRVTCDVAHVEGHEKHYQVDMPADGKGAKGGDVMTKTHAAGAAMTYGMRYLLKMIFNVAVGADDTDGNLPEETISETQVAALEALIEAVGADRPAFMKYIKVDSLDQILAKNYEAVAKLLQKKKKA